MNALEWILGICATLGAAALVALVAIGYKSRETLVGLVTDFGIFKAQVPLDIKSMGDTLTAKMESEVDKLTAQIDRVLPLEARLRSVEDHATLIREAHRDYLPWRAEVDKHRQDLERRVTLIEHDGETHK